MDAECIRSCEYHRCNTVYRNGVQSEGDVMRKYVEVK